MIDDQHNSGLTRELVNGGLPMVVQFGKWRHLKKLNIIRLTFQVLMSERVITNKWIPWDGL
jgi:hypothetical protein